MTRQLFWASPKVEGLFARRERSALGGPIATGLQLAIVAVLVAGAIAPAVWAQDDKDVDEKAPLQPQKQQQFMIADENFDQWVFGGQGNAAKGRQRLDSLLLVQIDEVEQICGIDDAQKEKLQLAGSGDIQRAFDRVEELRMRFQLVKNDQNKFNEFFKNIEPVQRLLKQGVFSRGCLFRKTLANMLSPEQAAAYDAAEWSRRNFRFRADVEMVIGSLDPVLGLRAEQREQLADLLVDEVSPPRASGQYEYYVVMHLASRVPEAKLKQILDEPQLSVLQRVFELARGYSGFLRSNGHLRDADDQRADNDGPSDKVRAGREAE